MKLRGAGAFEYHFTIQMIQKQIYKEQNPNQSANDSKADLQRTKSKPK